MTKQTKIGGGGAVDMERKSYEYETIFSFHKDGASVWWPEPSNKRVHYGAKLRIIQFVWLEVKFEYFGQF